MYLESRMVFREESLEERFKLDIRITDAEEKGILLTATLSDGSITSAECFILTHLAY